MKSPVEPGTLGLLKRYFVGWFQLQFVVSLAVHVTLFRYLTEDVSILVFNELPLLILVYTAITHDAFLRVIQHHHIKSNFHAWQLGVVARWWSQLVATLMALVCTARFLQSRVYWAIPISGILYLIQRRSQWFPYMTVIYRHLGNQNSARIRAKIESQEHIVAIPRHLLTLTMLWYPDNTIVDLYIMLASHAIESVAQTIIYQYEIQGLNNEMARTFSSLEQDAAPGFMDGVRILRRVLPYIINGLKTGLFQRGEHIAVLYLAPSIHIVHYYTILKSIRSALVVLIAQPIAYYMELVFYRDPRRNLFSFLYGIHGVGWVILNIISWIAAPVVVWPILSYYGGQEALDNPALVRTTVVLLMLFPIDIADAVAASYWQVHQTKPIALWLDTIMAILYVMFSVEVMRVWQLQGIVYALSLPVIWGALMRGAL